MVRKKKLDERMQRWRTPDTSSEGSKASKAVRSKTSATNVMMMRPETLLRFLRPSLATGER